MSILEQVKSLSDLILSVTTDIEDGDTFVRVVVNSGSMADIIEITKKANAFLEEKNYLNGDFYLDVSSKGTEQEIQLENIKDNIGAYILVEVKEKIRKNHFLEGEILSADDKHFILKFNNKGQILKLEILYSNIVFIKKTAKIGGAKYE